MSRIVHIVGQSVQVGPRLRQRCAWCGELLLDADERTLMVHPAPAEGEKLIKEWPPGALLAVEGKNPTSFYVVAHTDGDDLPAGWCGDEGRPRLREVARSAP